MKNSPLKTASAQSQRASILKWLRARSLTTLEARAELDVMHPAARILELRAMGHKIFTHWETVTTEKHKHRIARYVLYAGGSDGYC